MKKTIGMFTLGCKVNQYETEAIKEIFMNNQYEVVPFEEYADVYLINTCTVTHMSDKKSRQMIRRAKKTNPKSIVVVVGCYAQAAKEEIEQIQEVDLIVGTNKRSQLVELVEEYATTRVAVSLVDDIMEVREFEELEITNMDERTRAYLKIQEGCNNYCSYCIIPYVRGNIRSRKPNNVLEEVVRLANEGFKEIVLTGIHVASYGKDLKDTNLLDIIHKVHEIKGIERIRLGSIEPVVVTEGFINTVSKLSKVCHHFHLSLQSGSDSVLKRMKRKYTTTQYRESVELLRKHLPDVAFTTDIIVGFPGESEEEFNQTLDFVKEIGFSAIHVFPYSPRKGTPAATMEAQVPSQIKAERASKLIKVAKELQHEFLSQYLNKNVNVLLENNYKEDIYEGHTSNYIKVRVACDNDCINQFKNVKITSIKDEVLYGVIQ